VCGGVTVVADEAGYGGWKRSEVFEMNDPVVF